MIMLSDRFLIRIAFLFIIIVFCGTIRWSGVPIYLAAGGELKGASNFHFTYLAHIDMPLPVKTIFCKIIGDFISNTPFFKFGCNGP